MTNTLKAAFLGAGYIAKIHSKNLLKITGIEISSVCDIKRERAEDLVSSIGANSIKIYTDFEKMLNECNFDMLFICLPPFAHSGQLEAAVEKGVHVFIEKPIALDVNRARNMVEAIKKAGVVSQVGYHMRFGEAVKKLKNLIDSGIAGIPVLFDGRYECNSLHSSWWRDYTKSGGQVFEQVIHLYDLSMYFLNEPESICGFTTNLCHKDVPDYTVEDNSVSIIKFRTGGLGNIAATNCAVPMEWNAIFTVVCQNITAYFRDANNAEFIYTSKDPVERESVTSSIDMYFEEVKAFIQAVRGDGPALCTIEEGYKSLCMVDAVVKSSEQGGKVVKLSS